MTKKRILPAALFHKKTAEPAKVEKPERLALYEHELAQVHGASASADYGTVCQDADGNYHRDYYA